MVEFSSKVLRVFIMTINNKGERNYRGKCLGWPVTSYGGDGWLIAGNTHDIFVMQNKFILHGYIHLKTILPFLNLSTHFPNTTKYFLQLLENISNSPLPPSHPKDHVINVW